MSALPPAQLNDVGNIADAHFRLSGSVAEYLSCIRGGAYNARLVKGDTMVVLPEQSHKEIGNEL